MKRVALIMVIALGLACERAEQDLPLAADVGHAELWTRIGELDGPPEYLFGQIVAVAVGDGGVTYVADAIGSTVRAYGADGRYLTTVGSEGDGPESSAICSVSISIPVGT